MPFGRNVVITTDNVVIKVVISDRTMESLIGSPKDLMILFHFWQIGAKGAIIAA